jgi:DNA-binding response OmpR family regulator
MQSVQQPRPRVLFVEDEPSIYEPFSKALTREGFEPVVARTATRAIELAEGDFAIVLLDLTLPTATVATSAAPSAAPARSRSSC